MSQEKQYDRLEDPELQHELKLDAIMYGQAFVSFDRTSRKFSRVAPDQAKPKGKRREFSSLEEAQASLLAEAAGIK